MHSMVVVPGSIYKFIVCSAPVLQVMGRKKVLITHQKKYFFMLRNALPHKKHSHKPPHESDLRQQQKLQLWSMYKTNQMKQGNGQQIT
jgi:hypothetical protein